MEIHDKYDFTNKLLPIFKTKIDSWFNVKENNEIKSFGLYGEWGNGKTTLLKLFNEKYKAYNLIFVDLWKYEILLDDKTKILENILEMLINILEINIDKKYEKIKKAAKYIYNTGATLINSIRIKTDNVTFFTDLPKLDLREEEDLFLFVKEINEKIKDKKIIVVFDDLDRCSRNKIEEYISFIKNIANLIDVKIKTLMVFDYTFVNSLLFKNDSILNYFDKIIYDSFMIDEFVEKISDVNLSEKIYQEIFEDAKKIGYSNLRSREIIDLKVEEIITLINSQNINIISNNEKFYVNFIFILCVYSYYLDRKLKIKIKRFIEELILEIKIYRILKKKMKNNYKHQIEFYKRYIKDFSFSFDWNNINSEFNSLLKETSIKLNNQNQYRYLVLDSEFSLENQSNKILDASNFSIKDYNVKAEVEMFNIFMGLVYNKDNFNDTSNINFEIFLKHFELDFSNIKIERLNYYYSSSSSKVRDFILKEKNSEYSISTKFDKSNKLNEKIIKYNQSTNDELIKFNDCFNILANYFEFNDQDILKLNEDVLEVLELIKDQL
ncbi:MULTISPECIES: P-loop NTPase fold protein [Mesoplasma]|uniref:KAP NTPase domain-containing protein n=1 Tax=Mesoplasma florum TaxID=2151 RepID=A0A2R3P7L3_MESFO|nr:MULTISPECIES: P-loop NTPase fold protein [Mesoplasma]AVN64369.1 hypothetical protein CG003_01660 [Mesoplasma florum]